ncbi:hypothetical protein OROHE_005480 [Orobanche hederae]
MEKPKKSDLVVVFDNSNASEESMGGDMSALLPVLYVEDGKEIL